ncbi:MAG TPA: cytochrome c [Saprospiraceae bacterium]|nr:cytochrome c [Saprospiraceae bacterium]
MRIWIMALVTGLAMLLGCEQQPYQIGQRLYQAQCANCHMDNGVGLGALMPPLAGSDYLSSHRQSLPCIIRHGLQDTIQVNGRVYAEQMPGNKNLSEIQITNVLNYVLQSWGNKITPYTLEEVQQALDQCPAPK